MPDQGIREWRNGRIHDRSRAKLRFPVICWQGEGYEINQLVSSTWTRDRIVKGKDVKIGSLVLKK